MGRWILDDAPFHSLSCEIDEATLKSWPGGDLLVADATAQAAAQDKSGRRQQALSVVSESSGDTAIGTFQVGVASPAGNMLYAHLRKDVRGTADLAEHQSIVWALLEAPDAVLVTRDKHAALLALSELGKCRVCHPYELWSHLHEADRITAAQYRALLDRSAREDTSLPGIPWRLR